MLLGFARIQEHGRKTYVLIYVLLCVCNLYQSDSVLCVYQKICPIVVSYGTYKYSMTYSHIPVFQCFFKII